MTYFDPGIETMQRSDLEAYIDESVRYTVQYATEHSPFYRRRMTGLLPGTVGE